jgi:hypothetical protein
MDWGANDSGISAVRLQISFWAVQVKDFGIVHMLALYSLF